MADVTVEEIQGHVLAQDAELKRQGTELGKRISSIDGRTSVLEEKYGVDHESINDLVALTNTMHADVTETKLLVHGIADHLGIDRARLGKAPPVPLVRRVKQLERAIAPKRQGSLPNIPGPPPVATDVTAPPRRSLVPQTARGWATMIAAVLLALASLAGAIKEAMGK